MKYPPTFISFILLTVQVVPSAAENEFYSKSEARVVALSIAADVLGDDIEELSTNSEFKQDNHVEIRVDPLLGAVFEFSVGKMTIGVSERSGRAVTLSRPDCEPETWARFEITDTGAHLLTSEELRKRHVHVTAGRAYDEAAKVARVLAGEEILDEMGVVESTLTDQGSSFAFTYKWLKEDYEDTIRVGLRVLKVWANPVDGCIYRVSYLDLHPDRAGLVSLERAVQTAFDIHRNNRSDAPCGLSSGALIERFEDARSSHKYWAFVFGCEPTIIKIDAVTGGVIEVKD